MLERLKKRYGPGGGAGPSGATQGIAGVMGGGGFGQQQQQGGWGAGAGFAGSGIQQQQIHGGFGQQQQQQGRRSVRRRGGWHHLAIRRQPVWKQPWWLRRLSVRRAFIFVNIGNKLAFVYTSRSWVDPDSVCVSLLALAGG